MKYFIRIISGIVLSFSVFAVQNDTANTNTTASAPPFPTSVTEIVRYSDIDRQIRKSKLEHDSTAMQMADLAKKAVSTNNTQEKEAHLASLDALVKSVSPNTSTKKNRTNHQKLADNLRPHMEPEPQRLAAESRSHREYKSMKSRME